MLMSVCSLCLVFAPSTDFWTWVCVPSAYWCSWVCASSAECVLTQLPGTHEYVFPLPSVCSLCLLVHMSVCSLCWQNGAHESVIPLLTGAGGSYVKQREGTLYRVNFPSLDIFLLIQRHPLLGILTKVPYTEWIDYKQEVFVFQKVESWYLRSRHQHVQIPVWSLLMVYSIEFLHCRERMN